jgi:hypothetical protein
MGIYSYMSQYIDSALKISRPQRSIYQMSIYTSITHSVLIRVLEASISDGVIFDTCHNGVGLEVKGGLM